jgi:hypothetical protein
LDREAEQVARIILKYALYALMALALLWGLNSALGYVPFTPQWQAKRSAAKVEQLTTTVDTLQREAAGNAEIGRAVEAYHTREVIYRDIQSQADHEARSAPDASDPLPAERLARHLRNDERVCLDATFTCSPLDAPAGGPRAVPSDDAS